MGKGPDIAKSEESARRDSTFIIIVEECRGFYKHVLAIATAFLGGTLLFLEKISPNPSGLSLVLLGIGWTLLIVSILAVIWVRRLNIECGRLTLRNEIVEAEAIHCRSRKFTTAAGFLLGFGMGFVMAFGLVNFWNKPDLKQENDGGKTRQDVRVNPVSESSANSNVAANANPSPTTGNAQPGSTPDNPAGAAAPQATPEVKR